LVIIGKRHHFVKGLFSLSKLLDRERYVKGLSQGWHNPRSTVFTSDYDLRQRALALSYVAKLVNALCGRLNSEAGELLLAVRSKMLALAVPLGVGSTALIKEITNKVPGRQYQGNRELWDKP